MLKKSTKIWFFLSVALIFIVLVIGKSKKNLVTSCGLAEATTWEKLTALHIPINNSENIIWRENEEWDIYQMLVDINKEDDLISKIKQIPFVIVASPVNQLEYNNATVGQQVVVERVLQGDQEKVGKTVMFYQYSPFRIQSGKIDARSGMMLLNPEKKYILFLKPSELNGRQKKEIYYPEGIVFSCLELNSEIPVLEKKESYSFNELNGIELPSDSERIVEQMNKLRKKILSYYSL